jgi:prepilin-type processing-associated H-X9-DG protein
LCWSMGLWPYVDPFPTRGKVVQLDQVVTPSRMVCVADFYVEDLCGWGCAFYPYHDQTGRRINMGMLDGHAEGIEADPFQAYGPNWTMDYRGKW